MDAEGVNVFALLEYAGPSFRQGTPIADGSSRLDLRNSDQNERNVSLLLSSQSIRFNLDRPTLGWTGTPIRERMILTVPKEDYPRVESILSAAAEASVVELVKDTEEFSSW